MADESVLRCDPEEDPKRLGDAEGAGSLQRSGVCCVVWEFRFTLLSHIVLLLLATMALASEELLD